MKDRDLPTLPNWDKTEAHNGKRPYKCVTFGEIGRCFNGETRRGMKKEHSKSWKESLETGNIVSEMKGSLEDEKIQRIFVHVFIQRVFVNRLPRRGTDTILGVRSTSVNKR